MLEGVNIKLSGTIKDINGKSTCAILGVLASEKAFDSAKYDEMMAEKKISSRLKAPKEQILDDLDRQNDNYMKPDKKRLWKRSRMSLDLEWADPGSSFL